MKRFTLFIWCGLLGWVGAWSQISQQMVWEFAPQKAAQADAWPQEMLLNLPSSAPFYRLAVGWNTLGQQEAQRVALQYRWRKVGAGWKAWQPLGWDPHAALVGDEAHSTLVWVATDAQALQFRLAPGSPVTDLKRLRVDVFAPTHHRLPPETSVRTGQVNDCQALSYQSRSAWGCPDGAEAPAWRPEHTPVTHLVVHHTATDVISPYDALVRSIWDYHANVLGWGDIGYNWLIAPDGRIYEGRAGGTHVKAAHMCGRNSFTMGVAMLGTFTDSLPSDTALASLRKLLNWQGQVMGVDLGDTSQHAASGRIFPHIGGHRDGCAPGYTVCPGEAFYARLPVLRDSVLSRDQNCPNPLVGIGDLFCSSRVLSLGEAFPGDTLTAAVTQYYVGPSDTLLPSVVAYYLSNDCRLDSNDLWLGQDTSLLSATAYFAAASRPLGLPLDLAADTFQILFVADATEQWDEGDERNNLACRSLVVRESRTASRIVAPVQGFRLWPNPVQQHLHVRASVVLNQGSSWRLVNAMGQTVKSGKLSTGTDAWRITLDGNLAPGLYHWQWHQGGKVSSYPLLKE